MLPLIFVVESIFTQGPGKLSDCPGYLTLLVYILLFQAAPEAGNRRIIKLARRYCPTTLSGIGEPG